MFRVAWKFCSTRIIIASMIHLISIICGLGVCVFAKLCLESIVEMDDMKKITVSCENRVKISLKSATFLCFSPITPEITLLIQVM